MAENLVKLLSSPNVTLDAVAGLLNSLSPWARFESLKTLRRSHQRTLYKLAEKATALSLDDIVPAKTKALDWVRHAGINTLPVPRALRLFEKRFFRPRGGNAPLGGYNEGVTRRYIGPGYFVTYATAGKPEWEKRGILVVDYFQVPQGEVPSGGPSVVPNSEGLQRFVYQGTRDFLRRVSEGVSIGAAYKGEKPLDHYFVLCRLDEGHAA